MATLRVVPNGDLLYDGLSVVFDPTDEKIHVRDARGNDVARVNASDTPEQYLQMAAAIATHYPAPAPAPAPAPSPKFQVGFNAGYCGSASTEWVSKLGSAYDLTGVKLARIDYGRLTNSDFLTTTLGIARKRGAKVIFLVPDNAQASQVGPVVKQYLGTDELIEYGNETWMGTTSSTIRAAGAAYGSRVKAFMDGLHAAGISNKVIVQGDPAARGTGWFDGLYGAFPGVHAHPQFAGFSVHPYGPAQPTAEMDGYRNRLAAQHSQATAKGAPADVPVYVTEYGIATDGGRVLDSNYGWATNLSFSQAATALHGAILDFEGLTSQYNIRALIVFQDVDQQQPGASTSREGYFGFLQRTGTPKTPIVQVVKGAVAGVLA